MCVSFLSGDLSKFLGLETITLVMTMISLIVMLKIDKPYKDKHKFKTEFFNEIITYVIMLLL